MGAQAKKPHLFKVLFALPPSTARPTNQEFLEQVWFLGLRAPGLQKTSWPNERWRIPLLCPAVAGQRTPCCSGAEPKRFRLLRLQRPTQIDPPREPAGKRKRKCRKSCRRSTGDTRPACWGASVPPKFGPLGGRAGLPFPENEPPMMTGGPPAPPKNPNVPPV